MKVYITQSHPEITESIEEDFHFKKIEDHI
jgi:hypothetical protein